MIHGECIALDGVTLIGVEPFDLAHIRFDGGPTVFYGRNGTGKTRLLRAIEAALTGRSLGVGRVLLHGRLASATGIGRAATQLQEDLRTELQQQAWNSRVLYDNEVDMVSVDSDSDFVDTLVSHLDLQWVRAHQLGVGILRAQLLDIKNDWDELENRAFDATDGVNPTVVLEPCGASSPEWKAFLSAPMTTKSEFRADFMRRMINEDRDSTVRDLFAYEDPEHEDWDVQADYLVTSKDLSSAIDTSTFETALESWPDWASIPVLGLGRTTVLEDQGLRVLRVGGEVENDVDQRTREMVVAEFPELVMASDSEEVLLDPKAEDLIAEVETLSTTIFERLFGSGSTLKFMVGRPNDWFQGTAPSWVLRSSAGRYLPLKELAWSQRRWSLIAVRMALTDMAGKRLRKPRAAESENGSPALTMLVQLTNAWETNQPQINVLLLDEPELGLHRSAEERLPDVLNAVASISAHTFVATHSPRLLDAPFLRTVRVGAESLGTLSSLNTQPSSGTSDDLSLVADALGLSKSDLFLMVKLFVCVEGVHDEVVLNELLAASFDSSSVQMLRMGGAKGMKDKLIAPVIFDYTDARMLIVLDNLPEVASLWAEVVSAHQSGSSNRARALLRDLKDRYRSGEGEWLAELGLEAVRRGVLDRVEIVGLSLPDIVCYLPVEEVLGGQAEDWAPVIAQWRRSSRIPVDIKKWLGVEYSARLNEKSITSAARVGRLRPLPNDLVDLKSRIDLALLT